MVIDIHAHFVPPGLISCFHHRHAEFPDIVMKEEGGSVTFRFAGSEPTRPVIAALTDLGAQLEDMKARRIDHAILSLWTDLEGYELPPEQGLAWSRFIKQAHAGGAFRPCPFFSPRQRTLAEWRTRRASP